MKRTFGVELSVIEVLILHFIYYSKFLGQPTNVIEIINTKITQRSLLCDWWRVAFIVIVCGNTFFQGREMCSDKMSVQAVCSSLMVGNKNLRWRTHLQALV